MCFEANSIKYNLIHVRVLTLSGLKIMSTKAKRILHCRVAIFLMYEYYDYDLYVQIVL